MTRNKILIAIICIVNLFFASCASEEYGERTEQVKGLLNFTVQIPGEASEYKATVSGPYEDGVTIYIKVPTSEAKPLDVTALRPFASIEKNCVLVTPLPGIIDFTEPYEVKVKDSHGVIRTNYIEVLPTPQKTVFESLWVKSAQELQAGDARLPGIAVTKEHIWLNVTDKGIRVYDRLTGKHVKDINAPTSLTMQIKADEGGNIVVNRYNLWGAGFMVYLYENIDSQPQLILNYVAGANNPVELGVKMSVIGNLKQGKAYIYATAPNSMSYYYWEFNDGVVSSQEPTVVRYGGAGSNWTYASVKRKTLAGDSDHYVTYCHYDGADGTALAKGSRFDVFPYDENVLQMNKNNHYYKVLDFVPFTVNGDEFVAMIHQGFWAWDAAYIKVFETTNKGNFGMKPGDEGYDQFGLWESEYFGGTNYNRWGDIAVYVDGLDVYIYAAVTTDNQASAGVRAYKMTYTVQD